MKIWKLRILYSGKLVLLFLLLVWLTTWETRRSDIQEKMPLPSFQKSNDPRLSNDLSEGQWKDFTQFDGNANAFRILSHQFNGRREGGFALTYTTLASIVKYPFESVLTTKPKFGFFQSEKEIFARIAEDLGLLQQSEDPAKYVRHPLVFLVEAADDICYQLMDLEDAHKLKIHNFDQTRSLLMGFFDQQDEARQISHINETLQLVSDPNEQIAYLRASIIGKLVNQCVDVFWEKQVKFYPKFPKTFD